jgi:hypothetical protein
LEPEVVTDTLGDADADDDAVASDDFVEENEGQDAVGETVTD